MFKELKELGKHSLIYSASSVLAQAVGLVMLPVYTRYLTPADYGILSLVLLASSIAGIIVSFNIGSAIMRIYYDYETKKQKNTVISTATIFLLLMMPLFFIILYFLSPSLSTLIFGTEAYKNHLIVIFLATLLGAVETSATIYMMILRKSIIFSTYSVLKMIAALSLNILFVVFLHKGVMGILLSSMITSAAASIILAIWLFPKIGISFKIDPLKKMLVFSTPMIGAGLLTNFEKSVAPYVLSIMAGLSQTGLYSLGYKISSVIFILLGEPFSMIFSPFALELMKKGYIKTMFRKLFTYTFLAAATLSLATVILAKPLLAFAVHSSFFEAYKIVTFLAIAAMIMSVNSFFNAGITYHKKTWNFMAIIIAKLILTIALCAALIPQLGSIGAAIAIMLTTIADSAMRYFFFRKYTGVSIEWKRISIILATATVIFLASSIIPIDNIFISWGGRILLLALFPLILYTLGLFEKAEIEKIKQIITLLSKRKGIKGVFINMLQ